MAGFRLSSGGSRIDRSRPFTFTFDGSPVEAFAGDTIASALMASGRSIVARSFKYHRPRGIFSAGAEEPNALVTVGSGGEREPNVNAATRLAAPGLEVSGQNAWPSVDRDIGAVNQVFAPFFGAGFYYKTFIGPLRRSWMWYEPAIRRAAGMGSASLDPDPARYEKANVFADLLVVGAGPAGLAAALAAGRAGARVILAEAEPGPGGAIDLEEATIDGAPAAEWAAMASLELSEMANVRLMPRTHVWGYYDGGVLAALEDCGGEGETRCRHWRIEARQVILATGACERPIVFSGNDRPGVMLASAGLAYVRRYGTAPGGSIVLFCNNDEAWRQAALLAEAGVKIAAIVDPRTEVPGTLAGPIAAKGIDIILSHVVAAAKGARRVEAAVIAPVGEAARAAEAARIDRPAGEAEGESVPPASPGGVFEIAADTILVSGGHTPIINLASQAGGPPVWREEIAAFVPGEPRQDWIAAGAMTGAPTLEIAVNQGAEAGTLAANALGFNAVAKELAVQIQIQGLRTSIQDGGLLPLFEVEPVGEKPDKAFVDLQHDVTADDVRLAGREGFVEAEHLKRYTTLGMANDQGRTSAINGLAILAGERQMPIPAVGTTRFRPPLAPVPLGAIVGRERGHHMRPIRRSPLHHAHLEAGAEMMHAGLWLRPRVYAHKGEGLFAAYTREARHVRAKVGIADVSTLGKIEVAGPDAGTFLDRVYTNTFSTLPVGKARYGLMLREDGFVFDDGTAWRLAEDRYLVTTTTAKAAEVMMHMEFLLAAVWPELKTTLASVSDQYAGIAVAGPRSRALLARLVDGTPMDREAFPFMGVRQASIAGVPALIARLSFSGENAYEVYVGADCGPFLWSELLRQGADLEVAPYGLEAMGTLRIEKGHVAGPELNGRVSAHDLGLGKLLSKKKPFVGKPLALRPALSEEGRMELVGLLATDAAFRSGAHLVAGTEEAPGASEGHVTSVTYSPELRNHIGLAMLKGGRKRHGQTLFAADPIRGAHCRVEIVSPHFVDPQGERLDA
ncbi:sarcosine oxidase subunit alpha family protein [Afifella sp. IM 167]|uniref:sarcosine oxidase subunit alpha family protein n=1 Tax=Afifella sp. IM 167 TaxID=2033586 RepID=UPI001CCDB413|nr:sarcosine oxidase subunit alpha family protein [Afifella sp. IM 167]MBZ8134011.1 sarcosine oxidase subunit alpha family protein [Afifella sp. IM 167]